MSTSSWRKTAFRLCFTRLILTLKQTPRMHQDAPLPDKKIKKKFWGGGMDPSPTGRGYPFPRPHPLSTFGASIRARRSRSFSFTTRTLVIQILGFITIEIWYTGRCVGTRAAGKTIIHSGAFGISSSHCFILGLYPYLRN